MNDVQYIGNGEFVVTERRRLMNAELANLAKEIGRIAQSRQGSVVVTEKHGTFLKVTDQHWVALSLKVSAMMLTRFLPDTWNRIASMC